MRNEIIITELKDILVTRFGKNIDHVELFGSQAKGNAKKSSDYDVIIVLKNNYNWDYKSKINEVCHKIERKYDIWLDFQLISLNQIHNTLKGKHPLFYDVLKEKYNIRLTDKDRKALVKYRVEQAKKTIYDVEKCLENDMLVVAVNRIYYGMYYMLSALGLKHKFKVAKHKPLIDWFGKNFAEKNLIKRKYFNIVNNAFKNRSYGDYAPYIIFKKKEVLKWFDKMKDFMNELERYILQNE